MSAVQQKHGTSTCLRCQNKSLIAPSCAAENVLSDSAGVVEVHTQHLGLETERWIRRRQGVFRRPSEGMSTLNMDDMHDIPYGIVLRRWMPLTEKAETLRGRKSWNLLVTTGDGEYGIREGRRLRV